MAPVDLRKVKEEAPHMVSLVKEAMGVSLQKGLDPRTTKAAVLATIDSSGSAQRLFASGEVQKVADLCFAAGLIFDDDGEMPVSFFDNNVQDLGMITLQNCQGFIGRQSPRWGSTSYSSALRWIIEAAGWGKVKLGSGGGLFGRGSGGALEVKATAPYPTFAIFITDGQPNREDEGPARELLVQMSQLPIFVQFVGVGPARFEYLESLDTFSGRLVDNAGFFDAKTTDGTTADMLDKLMGEFPSYIESARRVGLIV